MNKHPTATGRIRPCFEAKQGKASRSPNPDRLANCNLLKRIQLQNVGSCPGSPGLPGSWRVDQVLPGHCTCRSFNKPEPVQLPDPRSTRWSDPGLITVVLVFKSHVRSFICLFVLPSLCSQSSLILYYRTEKKWKEGALVSHVRVYFG